MAVNDDDCVKRIIKTYLHFKGEASTSMIANHLIEVDYGLRKYYSPRSLTTKMRFWSNNSKSGGWFRVIPFKKDDRKTWWRLENE